MTKPCSSSTWRRRFLCPSVDVQFFECALRPSSMTNFSSSGFAASMRRCRSGCVSQIVRRSPMNFSNTGNRRLNILISLSFVQRLAFDGATAQETALLLRKVGAGVDGAAIVPHQEVAEFPDVLEDEFAPLPDVVELIEDCVAFRLFEPFKPCRHETVDE